MREEKEGHERKDQTCYHLTSDQKTSTDSPLVEHLLDAAFCFITQFDNLYNVFFLLLFFFHPCLIIGKRGVP